ncbi:MAG: dTDP-glucose 4,6-dehydratase [Clostridiales bacterium]|jgi:dTDP-glucose 4,6-dehydratase|nr:dTDP-glucose 4,6-dehydratase [Clostridiales bacterium]
MKTYLVTGGAGFIGSNFIIYMLRKYGGRVKIVNLDSLTYAGNLENLKDVAGLPGYVFAKADICDREAVGAALDEHGADYVVHFAAESHVDRSIRNPEAFVRTNVLGTQALLDAAMKRWELPDGSFAPGRKFVHVSTDEVYGALGETGLFTEQTPLDPHSPYSASKAASDLIAKAYWDTYRFPVCVTRCSNNYGPRQFPEKLIPLLINNALGGASLPVYGDGLQVRDWLYVEDHARAIDLVASRGEPGEVYNIGGFNEQRNIDIARAVIKTLRGLLPDGDARKGGVSESLIRHVADRKGHDRRYAIDSRKISEALGWAPETAFADGLEKTVRWYVDNGEWVRNVTSGAYAEYYSEYYGAAAAQGGGLQSC